MIGVAIGFVVLTGLVGIGAGVVAVKTWLRQRSWARATATVTRARLEVDSEGARSTRVHYAFTDEQGERRTGSIERLFRAEKRGDTVAVMYDPNDPDRNEDVSGRWLFITLAVVAVVFVGAVWALVSTAMG